MSLYTQSAIAAKHGQQSKGGLPGVFLIDYSSEQALIRAVLDNRPVEATGHILANDQQAYAFTIVYDPITRNTTLALTPGHLSEPVLSYENKVPLWQAQGAEPVQNQSRVSAQYEYLDKRITDISHEINDFRKLFISEADFNFLTLIVKGGLKGALSLAIFILFITSTAKEIGISSNPLRAIGEILGVSTSQPVDPPN